MLTPTPRTISLHNVPTEEPKTKGTTTVSVIPCILLFLPVVLTLNFSEVYMSKFNIEVPHVQVQTMYLYNHYDSKPEVY